MLNQADVKPDRLLKIAAALKAGGAAALIALGLFSLLIGVRTDQGPTGALVLSARPGALVALTVTAFVGGLLRGFVPERSRLAALVPESLMATLARLRQWVGAALLVFALLLPDRKSVV